MPATAVQKIPRKPKATSRRCSTRHRKSNASAPLQTLATVPVPLNKQSQLIDLLRRPEGATLSELISVMGWQAHSIRGIISGVLRKKLGLVVIRFKSESGESGYRIASPVVSGDVQSGSPEDASYAL